MVLLKDPWPLVEMQLLYLTNSLVIIRFMILFTKSRDPVPEAAKQPKNIFECPPWLTVGTKIPFVRSHMFRKQQTFFIPLCLEWCPAMSPTTEFLFI